MPLILPEKLEGDITSSDSEHNHCSVYSASQKGQLDIVRSLLDRGYDVNDRNTHRETALDVASRYGELEVARLLIERGADVDARDRGGWTPLITALEYGQLEVARLLLDHGADVNAKMRVRDTALHLASFRGYFEMITSLLERGADVNARNQDGHTPRQIAILREHGRIVELLSAFGESRKGITTRVRFIIQVTFDPHQVTNNSRFPFFFAPTTPPGMAQMILSLTSPLIVSQGAPTSQLKRTMPLKILAQTPVPPSEPLVHVIPAPAPTPHFAANFTDPAATSVSLQGGRIPVPPSGSTSHTARSFPALPEASNPLARPVAVSDGDFHQRSARDEADRNIVHS